MVTRILSYGYDRIWEAIICHSKDRKSFSGFILTHANFEVKLSMYSESSEKCFKWLTLRSKWGYNWVMFRKGGEGIWFWERWNNEQDLKNSK